MMMNDQELKQCCESIITQYEAYAIPAERMPVEAQALLVMARTTLAALTDGLNGSNKKLACGGYQPSKEVGKPLPPPKKP